MYKRQGFELFNIHPSFECQSPAYLIQQKDRNAATQALARLDLMLVAVPACQFTCQLININEPAQTFIAHSFARLLLDAPVHKLFPSRARARARARALSLSRSRARARSLADTPAERAAPKTSTFFSSDMGPFVGVCGLDVFLFSFSVICGNVYLSQSHVFRV